MTKRPMTVNAAAALEAAEGVAAIGFGLIVGWETISGTAVDPASAIGVTVLALAGGGGMLACARGLLRRESWSRSPTVLTQLFALPVAWSLWQSDQPLGAIPLGLAAVLTLVLTLSPPSTGWLVEIVEADDGPAETDEAERRQAGSRQDESQEEPQENEPQRDETAKDGPPAKGGAGGTRRRTGGRPT